MTLDSSPGAKTFHAFMELAVGPERQPAPPAAGWHEIYDGAGAPRSVFRKLLGDFGELTPSHLRALDERMEATLREMGVTFDIIRDNPWGRQPWTCDLLPHLFTHADWARITRGFRQRLRAFEMFLQDVYGKKEILRAGVVPIQPVLGSPHFRSAAIGLSRPRGSFLHLGGLCVARDRHGSLLVKHHHFSHATGLSYMMQNRRALARVSPELFQDVAVESLAETPLLIMEQLRDTAADFESEPNVVLLSPGAGQTHSTEQSFLARRMGISMVRGGDLLVLHDRVYLKTVRGLERVDVIFNQVPDAWLDPLVFHRDSALGVPGLVHCLRKGTVALVNAVGSQLADDRSLLSFAPQIIRYYLAEAPVLPSVATSWLGDLDQREMVLENLSAYRIRPIFRENTSGSWEHPVTSGEASLRAKIRRNPSHFVAQPREEGATTVCFERGRSVEYQQDHVVFAVRGADDFTVFPGALTRVFSHLNPRGDFGIGWTSKDSWVLSDPLAEPLVPVLSSRMPDVRLPSRQVTSRVAESFYWTGRYLERAHHQAYLISVIETLETEELNSAERRHYRPMWNRLLPPLEKSVGGGRRSIINHHDRYRLVLSPDPGTVVRMILRAVFNAESVQDSLSPEAWATITNLRARFQRARFRDDLPESEAARTTQRMADVATQLIPQFFAVCANTLLADDGWRFCEIGQMLERAVITANSLLSISQSFNPDGDDQAGALQATELELSAFLRLLGTRDAYRRIYQTRAEPAHVLELLWQHPEVPRSVLRCLQKCGLLLRESIALELDSSTAALAGLEDLTHQIRRIDWGNYVGSPQDEDTVEAARAAAPRLRALDLHPLLQRLLGSTLDIHTLIADSFLNHQAHIAQVSQPTLAGLD